MTLMKLRKTIVVAASTLLLAVVQLIKRGKSL